MPDDTFFTDPQASWGNQNVGVRRVGEENTACTMLLGLRLLHYLGAKRVFLLGVDFRMQRGIGNNGNYAFGQQRNEDAIQSNNEQYRIVGDWMTRIRPTFEKFGFQVFNCNPLSGLRAFDYVPFSDALEICRGVVPDDIFDLSAWYEKQTES